MSRKKLVDLEDPFFAPLWIRVAVVLFCFGWGGFEFYLGAPLWGTLFVGVGAICGWRFATIDYRSKPDE